MWARQDLSMGWKVVRVSLTTFWEYHNIMIYVALAIISM